MTQSSYFEQNPSLYAFLPVFYLVWADAVLTPTEIQGIRNLINKQDWLSSEEQTFLLSFIDPKNPPSPQQLKQWQAEIRATAGNLDEDLKKTLSDIAIQMAEAHLSEKSKLNVEK